MAHKKNVCYYSKTGSKMVGILSTIGGCLSIYGLIVLMPVTKHVNPNLLLAKSNSSSYIFERKKCSLNESSYIVWDWRNPGTVKLIFMIVQSMYSFFSLFLLIGIFKNKPRLMTPWIIFDAIRQMILLIFAIICTWTPFLLFNLDVNCKRIVDFIPIAAAVAAIIVTAFSLYCWMVVKEEWNNMQAAKNDQNYAQNQLFFQEKKALSIAAHAITAAHAISAAKAFAAARREKQL